MKITVADERTDKKQEFQYKGGIVSFVEYLNKNKTTIHPKPIHLEGEKEGVLHRHRPAVQRRVRGEPILLCQQHQHASTAEPI